MSAIDDGGPAFPVPMMDTIDGMKMPVTAWGEFGGMSLRDYFAAQALAGLVVTIKKEGDAVNMGTACYALADAMLAARRAKQ